MGQTSERTKKGFSETRTIVIGAHLLLGFQYEALFQPGFEKLPPWAQDTAPFVFALLALAIAFLIAPTPFHRIGELGQSTRRLNGFMDTLLLSSLWPFAVAMGLEVADTAAQPLGARKALAVGAAAAAAALALWFIPALAARSSENADGPQPREEAMSIKDRIKELLEEARIVLPGVQALLGFQFAAYLSDGYAKLPHASQTAHSAALVLLLVSMVLLMAPAPFHRIACGGRPTPLADKVGVGFVLAALPPLALAVALDFYVVLQKVTGDSGLSACLGAASVLVCLLIWFAVPLAARGRPIRSDHQSQGAHARS